MTEVTASGHGANPGVKVDGVKVVGTQGAAIADVTTAFGTGNDALVTIANTDTADAGAAINDNFADCVDKITEILAALRAHGIIAT